MQEQHQGAIPRHGNVKSGPVSRDEIVLPGSVNQHRRNVGRIACAQNCPLIVAMVSWVDAMAFSGTGFAFASAFFPMRAKMAAPPNRSTATMRKPAQVGRPRETSPQDCL